MSSPLLYELNTRCWLRQLSEAQQQPITLANVPEGELAGWCRLGFTHIWLMGVWSSGALARKQALASASQRREYAAALADWREEDVAGSPYAIADYHVAPALGGEEGLNAFRRNLHARGLKLLLDFVPNHLGLDHPWLGEHPDWFVQSDEQLPGTFSQPAPEGLRWLAHGKDPNFAAWRDTAQLDYRRPATRAAMIELLRSIAERCDGVRCDMAMLLLNEVFVKTWAKFPIRDEEQAASPVGSPGVPPRVLPPGESLGPAAGTAVPPGESVPAPEFWSSAIAAIRQAHPDFVFLAEVYWGLEARLRALGFDYTYDKELYDFLATPAPAQVQRHLLQTPPQGLAAGVHFLENHDEPRIAGILETPGHRAAALVVLGLPGMRFLHEGQLTGARLRTPVQLVRRAREPEQPEVRKNYEALLSLLPRTAVGQGSGELLKPRAAWTENRTAENFVIVQWQAQASAFDLVVVNLAAHRSQCYAPLSIEGLAAHNWSMKDLLGEERYVRWGEDLQQQGLYLDLPPYGAQLFHFEPVA